MNSQAGKSITNAEIKNAIPIWNQPGIKIVFD